MIEIKFDNTFNSGGNLTFGQMHIWYIIMLGVLAFSPRCISQVLTPITADPASLGMGSISLPTNTYYQPTGNPANLAAFRNSGFGLHTIQPFGLNELSTTSLYGWINTGSGGFGGGTSYTGFGNMREYALFLGFGHRLWNRLDLGVTLEGQMLDLSDYGSNLNMGFSIGGRIGIMKDLTFGVLARNPINITQNKEVRLPTALVTTLSYELSTQVQMAFEWYQEEQQTADIRIGIVYKPVPNIPLRIGYQTRTSSFFVGAGYVFKAKLDFSVAAGYHPYLGFTPTAGLYYSFN